MEELKAVKITNPMWLGNLGKFIAGFLDKVPVVGISYETLYTYFAGTVQHGGSMTPMNMRDGREFWVVFKDSKPIAFAHWFVKGPPYIGTVYMDYIFSWNTKKEPVQLLLEKFGEFGVDHRAKYWEADAANERVFSVFKNAADRLGYEVVQTNRINGYAVKK
jgi:hypothetical protein